MAYVLRNAAVFLNFPRLSAVAHTLRDVLPVGVDAATPTLLSPQQAKLLITGFDLAARLVNGLANTGAEPRLDTDMASFAIIAQAQGLECADTFASILPPSDKPSTSALSNSQKVANLLNDNSTSPAPQAAPSRPAAAADMVSIFIQDAEEILDHAEQDLLTLEQDPEKLHDLLRQFHTLKGNCGLMGYDSMQQFSHQLESVLQRLRDLKLTPTTEGIRVLFEAVDALRHAVAELAKGGEPQGLATETWLNKLAVFNPQAPVTPTPAPDGVSTPVAPLTSDSLTPPASRSGIRVNVERLDQLNDLSGELVIAAAMVQHMSANRPEVDPERFNRAFHQLNLITSSLQDVAMAMRMVPIETAFRRLPRLARELADKTGKKIDLQLVGADTEVDRRVSELIADPLVHMVRNAVDHGLETAEERRRCGKPETGTIYIEALHRSGEVWINVSDDGRGLLREKILERARALGLLGATESPRDTEIFALIFEPGFSTAAQVTEVSGRGVGLDVVKRNIERLRGRIEAQSIPNLSTTFTLRIPLTLAVIQGMIVRVGTEQFVLPITTVCESFRPEASEVRRVLNEGEMIALRGDALPLFRLANLFELADATQAPEQGVVTIVEDGERRVALLLDELIGQQRVVVKSVSGTLGRPPGVAGASILADGRVRLILDVPGLIRLAHETRK